ncbi:MAG: hypothetical protein RIS36_1892 [Pseudomonadota bacterium]|jgi:hypothetical protein
MRTHKQERTELRNALRNFAVSPRFGFLKSIQVGPLLGDDASSLGPLAEMTFEQLIAADDENSSHLRTLNEAQERLLIAVLHALAEGEVAESAEPAFEEFHESEQDPVDGSSETTFNSVQCELELRDRVVHLKAHPYLDRVADLTLGTFWGADTPRAPFEESLTIRQFLALDLGVLAKKRSMTSARMRSLAHALEGASRRLDVVEERRSSPVLLSTQPDDAPRISPRTHDHVTRHRWHDFPDRCSPLEMALVEAVMNASSDQERDAMNVFGALHHFCAAFSVSEFLRIMKGEQLSVPTARKLTAWVNSGAVREVVPLVRMALQGPGTHISRVARVLQGHLPAGAVFAIVATLIARGLGAIQVSVDGDICPDVWSCNPGLVPLVVRHIRDERKPTPSKVSDLCPHLDPFLHDWLKGIIFPQKRAKKGPRRR